ncbi:MAG: DoxX family protein [Patescibacteria group bacterium]
MKTFHLVTLVLLRVSLGWLFFYAGITKILNPAWSAVGYLESAQTFTGFYAWLTTPDILPVVNILNEWGLTLLGVSLILGLFVRVTSVFGAVLMLLYYFPGLTFPLVEHGFLVDDHIVYTFALLFFAATSAGRIIGLDRWCAKLPLCKKFPRLRALIG